MALLPVGGDSLVVPISPGLARRVGFQLGLALALAPALLAWPGHLIFTLPSVPFRAWQTFL